jgi:hypothetical protein
MAWSRSLDFRDAYAATKGAAPGGAEVRVAFLYPLLAMASIEVDLPPLNFRTRCQVGLQAYDQGSNGASCLK